MDLAVDQLSAILFQHNENHELIDQLNITLRKLIQNDMMFIDGKLVSPQLWECKWLNDDSIAGYQKGYAVWMNTNSYDSVFSSNRERIIEYVQNNPVLRQLYDNIDQSDYVHAQQFLMDAMTGKASNMVSAIYVLGQMNDHVQVRVSLVDNNKAYPDDDSCWKDFYIRSTFEDNTKLLEQTAISCMQEDIDKHIDKYHLKGVDSKMLNSLGFFKKYPNLQLENIQLQHFYDHTYCTEMDGFDFVKTWKTDRDDIGNVKWCRIWNSGYIEQGGFAINTGEPLIYVGLMTPYNYPVGQPFYQSGYTLYAGACSTGSCNDNVVGQLSNAKRYMLTVTPQLKDDAENAYPENPSSIAEEIVYACVDVTKLDNDGFSFVNIDLDKSYYSSYAWHVAGYAT